MVIAQLYQHFQVLHAKQNMKEPVRNTCQEILLFLKHGAQKIFK